MKLTRQNMKYFVFILSAMKYKSKSKFRNHYFLFLFAFSILSQLFLIWGCILYLLFPEKAAVTLLSAVVNSCMYMCCRTGPGDSTELHWDLGHLWGSAGRNRKTRTALSQVNRLNYPITASAQPPQELSLIFPALHVKVSQGLTFVKTSSFSCHLFVFIKITLKLGEFLACLNLFSFQMPFM